MKQSILTVNALSIQYNGQENRAVQSFNLKVFKGQTVGLVGESGSGKSSIAHAIMGLLHEKAHIEGEIIFQNKSLSWDEMNDWDFIRWKRIALVFQNALNVLNPMMKVYKQVSEPIVKHLNLSRENARRKATLLLEEVGLDQMWWDAYPHQLSGGMRQKVLIAMALSCDPELLIIDEPTMSLDPEAKYQVVELLKRLQAKLQFGLIVISHEMNIIKALCSEIHVLYKGYPLEYGITEDVLEQPKHPYTKGLLGASWEMDAYKDIWGIPELIREQGATGCPFYSRCFQAQKACQSFVPQALELNQGHVTSCGRGGIVTLLNVEGLSKKYNVGKRQVLAVSNVGFEVNAGEVLTIIGPSGSGKSTLALLISGFEKSDAGRVYFEGCEINPQKAMSMENGIQLVVQDPSSAMNPDWRIEEVLFEPMRKNRTMCKHKAHKCIRKMLRNVHLPNDEIFLSSKAGTLSGGEKQRIAIARALLMSPKLLIADEFTAMLDPSSAANLVKLLKGMQNRFGFSMIYITHDLYLARKISDRTLLLQNGIVEAYGNSATLIDQKLLNLKTTQVENKMDHPKEVYAM
ncbi:ABC transporter ATP-binding protein [Fusibacter ferrireducens]|uniref:ABC transporter ATP-binding protein n=1 Tax=Fusibacter ferrireducens TaxID=2785058 RepID=A0ABR9ZRG4_9FIRM|nr:ABC transporter ATP-binding protein [Fusibacter ferrireducens]MBF4693024.1 ABC transporter ATP-binding protein [Fusibacter ferrireducens]